jgi:non-ribosomal peptide synthetase component F
VAVALREAPRELWAAGVTLEPVELVPGAPRLDLSLELSVEGEGLAGWIEYRRDLYDAATARRLAAGLEALLRAAAAEEPALMARDLELQASTQAQPSKELLE